MYVSLKQERFSSILPRSYLNGFITEEVSLETVHNLLNNFLRLAVEREINHEWWLKWVDTK